MSWMRYPNAEVESTEDFRHQKLVVGTCRSCERKFEVLFTKDGPDTTFNPYAYECPCGTYVYYPDDGSESVRDVGLKPEQLRLLVDRGKRSLFLQS